ncbi:MAG: T9SS type A sorting domain-containing protein [Saprospiraceae bacterium]
MKKVLLILSLFTFFSIINELSAKCDCIGNEIITVCQNGVTKRINCSAQSSPNVFCGPCSLQPNCTPGAKCDDGNKCTNWDKYDDYCNCNGKLADADKDGVCDAVDQCPGGDDLKDQNKNGMPDDCEGIPDPVCSECIPNHKGEITICWIPRDVSKMQSVKATCEWLTNFFNEDGSLKGKSKCGPCDCAYRGQKDSDNDGICDDKDDCPNDPNNNCKDVGGNDECDTECQPTGDTEYEWIDKISMNQLENQTGDNGGYADFKHLVLELGQGDSLSLWVFPTLLQEGCEVSMRGYIDWNNDCDFDDAGEIIFDNRTDGENGADIAVPKDAAVGDLTVRFIVHNGRIKSACQDCIDGEVEDYTLRVFKRNDLQKPNSQNQSKTQGKSLEVFPNPILENQPFVLRLGDKIIDASEVTIYNLAGQFVENIKSLRGDNIINGRKLQAGLYIFELKNDQGIFRQNVIIAK